MGWEAVNSPRVGRHSGLTMGWEVHWTHHRLGSTVDSPWVGRHTGLTTGWEAQWTHHRLGGTLDSPRVGRHTGLTTGWEAVNSPRVGRCTGLTMGWEAVNSPQVGRHTGLTTGWEVHWTHHGLGGTLKHVAEMTMRRPDRLPRDEGEVLALLHSLQKKSSKPSKILEHERQR